MNYDRFIDPLLEKEQGYVFDPDDPGGETNWGVTVKTARRNGYDGPMVSMPQSVARKILENRYILEPRFDDVAAISEKIAGELIDTGVNMGPHRAAEMLQRWLNGFNCGERYYEDLFVDGRVGPATLGALHDYLEFRGREGEAVLFVALNCTQGTRYLDIVEGRPASEKFLYGWMRTRVADIVEIAK